MLRMRLFCFYIYPWFTRQKEFLVSPNYCFSPFSSPNLFFHYFFHLILPINGYTDHQIISIANHLSSLTFQPTHGQPLAPFTPTTHMATGLLFYGPVLEDISSVIIPQALNESLRNMLIFWKDNFFFHL